MSGNRVHHDHVVVLNDTWSANRVELVCACGWEAVATPGPEASLLAAEHLEREAAG